jgi:4-hydroxy-2-oxoheptanedioate aldolase
VLDLQHNAPGEADLAGVMIAVAAAGALPSVGTRSARPTDIGRPLDLGAQGVFVPNVRSAGHVRKVLGGGTNTIRQFLVADLVTQSCWQT